MIVAKYKFDSSVYSNLIPVFNDGYNGYTVSDEIDSENSNHIIRTIECNSLPTRIDFGVGGLVEQYTNKSDSLLAIYNLDTSAITDGSRMFKGCRYIIEINTSDWNTNNMVNMIGMFSYCTNLTSLDVSNFNTSNVTTMQSMFANCTNLTSLDVSNFNTGNVTNMESMFNGCKNLTSLDVSNFDTSKVTSMRNMFNNCNKLTSLDVSNWDTSNVTDMYAMINNCHSLTSLDVSNWDTSNVTTMQAMFADSYLLSSLDMSNWSDNRLNTAQSMFDRCNLHSLLINNFNIFKTVTTYSSFNGSTVKKLYVNDKDIIQASVDYLPSRVGEEPGYIVTALRDQIDDETKTALATKNWEIVDLVAQYRYDANTYENLIPEFNTEFSSDKYEVNDSISEIVIGNMVWEKGGISERNGLNTTGSMTSALRTKYYYSVMPDITYNFKFWTHYYWYDKDKNFISHSITGTYNQKVTAPNNAKYVRLHRGDGSATDAYNMVISAKLITRSIESKNGDLPTQMYFGNLNATTSYYTGGFWSSLLKVYGIITSSLTTMRGLFRWCDRLTNVDGMSTWDTSNVVDMGYLFDCCKSLTSLDVSNFDTSNVTTMNHMFNINNQLLTTLDVSNFNTDNVTAMYSMFANCPGLTSLDVSNFDTSKVTSMGNMFANCPGLTSLDVSNFDTSKVTSMGNMFQNCSNLTSITFGSNFDTSNVTSMSGMFYDCFNLITLDVSNFNTSNVTSMTSMFYGCTNLTSLDVSNWDTSNVNSMQSMFNDCNNLTTLDVSKWNTSKVTTMYAMFYGCKKLTSLDVSNWNTSNVTNMYNMFYNCKNLTSLDVSNFNTSKVTDMRSMFWKCTKLKLLILSNWNFSKVTSMGNIFSTNVNVKMSLETLDIVNCEISDSTDTNNLFYNEDSESLASIKNIRCNNANVINNVLIPSLPTRSSDNKGQIITSATLTQETINTLASKNWTVVSDSTLTKVAEYVYDSNTWNSLIPEFNNEFIDYFIDDIEDENGLVTRTISSLGGLPTIMGFGVKYPNPIGLKEKSLYNVNYIDTSNLISANEMFRYCANLMSINTANWDTSKITNMSNMFFQCDNLTELDVSNFNTSKVTAMGYMFHSCTKLTSLDLSNFDTSKVTVMGYMFNNCTKLTSLDLSNFDTSKVTNISNMFHNTSKLSDIGMLYCTPSTINALSSNLPTTHTQIIWVQDTKPNECTVVSGVEFKEYKENSVMINLNSPLLNGDRIEVVDGKLCHYHKMGKVVLDGSEDEEWYLQSNINNNETYGYISQNNIYSDTSKVFCNTLPTVNGRITTNNGSNTLGIFVARSRSQIRIRITHNDTLIGIKQWLSENPTTVIYELANPYYEDITPIQSKLTLETYLESNLDIYTDLPIKTNLTYLTNITNTSSIEEEINTINEGTDLTNLLEDEINN